MSLGRKLRFFEPCHRELRLAIRHVFSTKNTGLQHLLRCELGFEPWVKTLAGRHRQRIPVIFLHKVIDADFFRFHGVIIPRQRILLNGASALLTPPAFFSILGSHFAPVIGSP